MDRETQKFWRQRRNEMLQRDRRERGRFTGSNTITMGLIGLLVLGWIIQNFVPGILAPLSSSAIGPAVYIVVSTIMPGTLLGLLFSGIFVWIIGTTVEAASRPWQYLSIFFGSGIVANLVLLHLGGAGSALAAFGLAGAYVYSMSRFNQRGAAQWALILLGINVVLSGFQVAILAGELTAFVVGLAIAALVRIGQ